MFEALSPLISEVPEACPNLWELLAPGSGAGPSGEETGADFGVPQAQQEPGISSRSFRDSEAKLGCTTQVNSPRIPTKNNTFPGKIGLFIKKTTQFGAATPQAQRKGWPWPLLMTGLCKNPSSFPTKCPISFSKPGKDKLLIHGLKKESGRMAQGWGFHFIPFQA